MLDEEGAWVGSVKDPGFRLEPLGLSHRRVVAQDDTLGSEEVDEDLGDELLAPIHGQREGLQDKMRAVAVDNHSGQPIRLAPDKAAELWVEVKLAPQVTGHLDPATEKVLVELLPPPRKSARDDLALGVVDRGSERAVPEILDGNDLSGLGIAEYLLNLAGIDPIVAVKDAGAGSDNDSWHGGMGSIFGCSGEEEVAGAVDFA